MVRLGADFSPRLLAVVISPCFISPDLGRISVKGKKKGPLAPVNTEGKVRITAQICTFRCASQTRLGLRVYLNVKAKEGKELHKPTCEVAAKSNLSSQ